MKIKPEHLKKITAIKIVKTSSSSSTAYEKMLKDGFTAKEIEFYWDNYCHLCDGDIVRKEEGGK